MMVDLALVEAIVRDSQRPAGRRLLLPSNERPMRLAADGTSDQLGVRVRSALRVLLQRPSAASIVPCGCATAGC